MLLSSSGIAYAQHFCGGMEMLSEITLGETSLSCGMDMASSSCDANSLAESGYDCCDTEHTTVSTDDVFAKASFLIKFQQPSIACQASVFLETPQGLAPAKSIPFPCYNPPPLEGDLPVLFQAFLI